MRMSTRGIPRASMAATSGRHVMVLVYLNVRIRLSILHILWQDVSCNMCSRKSTYRHCAHGSHRQQWLELCANAQHMQSKRQEHTQRHGHALSKVSTGARTPTPIFGIPGSAEAHVNTQHPKHLIIPRSAPSCASTQASLRPSPCMQAERAAKCSLISPYITNRPAEQRFSPHRARCSHRVPFF